jgi:hypothetical protein
MEPYVEENEYEYDEYSSHLASAGNGAGGENKLDFNKDDPNSKDKGRGSYRCGKCGVPKKGHVCPYQPRLKRRPDDPPPEMRNIATQVEMDEFLVIRRLNLEIQGYPETYASEPLGDVGSESYPTPSALAGVVATTANNAVSAAVTTSTSSPSHLQRDSSSSSMNMSIRDNSSMMPMNHHATFPPSSYHHPSMNGNPSMMGGGGDVGGMGGPHHHHGPYSPSNRNIMNTSSGPGPGGPIISTGMNTSNTTTTSTNTMNLNLNN